MSPRVKMARLVHEAKQSDIEISPVRLQHAAKELALWDAGQRGVDFPTVYAEQNWPQFVEPAKRVIVAAAEAA